MMNLQEIKKAVKDGKTVNWKSAAYTVRENSGLFMIHCNMNNSQIGLTGMVGTKYENVLNGQESDFFIEA